MVISYTLLLFLISSSASNPFFLPDDSTARLLTDIDEVSDSWKQYRSVLKDGFFVNDSFIVVADYYGDTEEDASDKEEFLKDHPSESVTIEQRPVHVPQDELGEMMGIEESGDLDHEDTEEDDTMEKGSFELTMTGMMNALADIQAKGDLMMNAIRGQRQVLFQVREEVAQAEQTLSDMKRKRMEEEQRKRKAVEQRKLAEARNRMMELEKEQLEKELVEVEKEREEKERRLQEMETEVKKMNRKAEENGSQISRLNASLTPLTENLTRKKSELVTLEKTLKQKTELLESFQVKINTSEEILSKLKAKIEDPDLAELPSIPSSSYSDSDSMLFPALLISGLLNIVTGAHVVSSYLSPKPANRRDQHLPIQFVAASTPSPTVWADPDSMEEKEDMMEDSWDQSSEHRFQDRYTQDVYYNLPRGMPQEPPLVRTWS